MCKEDYVSGASRRCHECSGENRRFAVGFATTVLLLVLLAAVLVLSYLLQVVGDGAHQAQRQPRRWWQEKLSSFRNFLVKAMPLSSIRIVVVVSQIVIQVRAPIDSHTHKCVRRSKISNKLCVQIIADTDIYK